MQNFAILSGLLLVASGCTAVYDFSLPEETVQQADCTNNTDCPIDGQVCQADGSCVTPEPRTSIRVGYIYPASVGDHGWVKAHDDGRLFLETLDNVTTTFVPNVQADGLQDALDTLLADGVNVVVSTSSAYLQFFEGAAERHPDVEFLLCAGLTSGDNYGSYFGRMYQAKWLAGRLAGQMTTTNRIGYVGSFAFPQTVRHLNAFTEGVRSVNPDAVVMVEWLNSFFDPVTEELRANSLLALNVDVIHGSTNTPVAVEVADGRTTPEGDLPVYSIGYDNENTCALFGPESCITSAYWNWNPLIGQIVTEIRDGTWDPNANPWTPLKINPEESVVAINSPTPGLVSSNIRLDVESFIPKFADGEMDAFDDVTEDINGNPRSVDSDADLLEMCWLVPGVVTPGEPPFMPAIVPNSCDGER